MNNRLLKIFQLPIHRNTFSIERGLDIDIDVAIFFVLLIIHDSPIRRFSNSILCYIRARLKTATERFDVKASTILFFLYWSSHAIRFFFMPEC